MSELEDYARLLTEHAPHFAIGEFVDGTRTRMMPPRIIWTLMIQPAEWAEELRERLRLRCELEGWTFHGLRIKAAYRPIGGAKDSRHKRNRALDLDLMFIDWDPARVSEAQSVGIRKAWYEILVAFWWEHRNDRMGLGLYCGVSQTSGVRGHIDDGGTRTWQGVGATFAKQPATYKIAKRLGLMQ